MKIKDYHRGIVARYYGVLIRKHGFDLLLRNIPRLSRIVWTDTGFASVERRLGL